MHPNSTTKPRKDLNPSKTSCGITGSSATVKRLHANFYVARLCECDILHNIPYLPAGPSYTFTPSHLHTSFMQSAIYSLSPVAYCRFRPFQAVTLWHEPPLTRATSTSTRITSHSCTLKQAIAAEQSRAEMACLIWSITSSSKSRAAIPSSGRHCLDYI